MIIQRNQFDALFGALPESPGAANWCSEAERCVILSLALHIKPKTVIEFGVQIGDTAKMILSGVPGIKKYIGIDLPQDMFPALASQGKEMPAKPASAVASRKAFELKLADSKSLTSLDLPPADLIYIDGGHDQETVAHDTALAMELIRSPGVIIWDDYNALPEIGVRPVIDQLNRDTGDRITLVQGTWICFRLY